MQDKVLFNENVTWYKSPFQAFQGNLLITNDSIVFTKELVKTPGGGLIGKSIELLKEKYLENGVLLNQDTNNVKFIRGKSIGKKTFFLEVHVQNQKVFKFLFDDSWLMQIDQLVELK